jgi:hypothetical protein
MKIHQEKQTAEAPDAVKGWSDDKSRERWKHLASDRRPEIEIRGIGPETTCGDMFWSWASPEQ